MQTLKNYIYKHKNKTTAELIEKINNSKYNEHLLWKSTKFLKKPTKRNTIISAKQIKTFQKLLLFTNLIFFNLIHSIVLKNMRK